MIDYTGYETVEDMQAAIGEWARGKGWWDPEHADVAPKIELRNALELCALIHTEVSEAVEAARMGQMLTEYVEDKHGVMKPEGFYSELADAVIRIMDTFDAAGVSLFDEIAIKMQYNETRARRHGGKLA